MIEFIFSLFPKNWGKDYVQGWYCIGIRHGEKYKYSRPIAEFICKLLTGHEISKTEWGWSGGEFIDCHCRWCDKVIKIPKDEARFRFDTFNEWGKDQFQEKL